MKESKSMRDIFKLSFGEEIGNSVSHGTMALLLLFALPAVSIYSYIRGGLLRGFGVSVYVICIFLMFLISCIYHTMDYKSTQKYIFRKLDHICIYLAIAGSYTPIILCLIQGVMGYIVVVAEWIAVIAGILLKSISSKSHPVLSMVIYMCMGWAAILILPSLIAKASIAFLALIIAGGVLYTIGAYFYSHPQHSYFHFIWHICIVIASLLHFIAIVFIM